MYDLRRAVVVGINEYINKTELEELSGAENDAQELWDILVNPERGGFSEEKSHLLIGIEETKCSKIRKALSDVFYKTEKCEIALFYFSGHGRELDFYNEGYIAPSDFSSTDPIVHGITMNELRRIISRSYGQERVKCPISILDCCYSGISTEVKKGGNGPKAQERVQQRFNEHLDVTHDKGVVLIASSGLTEESAEIRKAHKNVDGSYHAHGALTYHLLNGFEGEAEGSEGRISIESLFKYARDELEKSDKKQTPLVSINQSVGADKIFISRISQKTDNLIELKLKEVKEYLKIKDPGPGLVIFNSLPRIAYVLKYDKKNPEAIKYKERVMKDIDSYGKPCDWLANNVLYLEGATMPHVIDRLEKLVGVDEENFKPNFDKWATMDQDTLKLITYIYQAHLKEKSLAQFIGYCKPVENNLVAQKSYKNIGDPI